MPGPDYMSQAGPVSRAGSVCQDLGMFVKRNKNQLRNYMTTGLKILHVITFTGPASNFSSEHDIQPEKIHIPPSIKRM